MFEHAVYVQHAKNMTTSIEIIKLQNILLNMSFYCTFVIILYIIYLGYGHMVYMGTVCKHHGGSA